MRPIEEIAAELGLDAAEVEPYGRHIAKIGLGVLERLPRRPESKYICVTSMSPTPFGEGKTTVAIGLAGALARLGQRPVATLRQASLGPTLGVKGGASGGGRAQIVPAENVNLGLTGDIHAVETAHNLLAAVIDNHLHHGNALQLDSRSITWRRAVDLEDRALRNVVTGLGSGSNGVPRETGFEITAASEVMGALTLCGSLPDLRARLERIVIGATRDGRPVTAGDLRCAGAMAALLRHAVKPNLLQTLEGTPILLHGAAFANLGLGNSSILADEIGLRLADVVVTECGFGAEMGLEKFVNIKCRASGLEPGCAVVVATTRALKFHSGALGHLGRRSLAARLAQEDLDLLRLGAPNLEQQIANVRRFRLAAVVGINRFASDTQREIDLLRELALEAGASAVEEADAFGHGGAGVEALAEAALRCYVPPGPEQALMPTYEPGLPLAAKIEAIARACYGASGITLAPAAGRALARLERDGYGGLPVLMAKTPLSLSHDPARQGRPAGFAVPVTEVRLAAGAGYVTALCGEVQGMPGLPSVPAGERIDLDAAGRVVGLE